MEPNLAYGYHAAATHGAATASRPLANECCSPRERCGSVDPAWSECRAKHGGRNLDTYAADPAFAPAWRAVASRTRRTRRRPSQRRQPLGIEQIGRASGRERGWKYV